MSLGRHGQPGAAKSQASHAVRRIGRSVALIAFGLCLGLGGGTAWAYFTSAGSGTGHATVGSPVSIAITATTGTADLLPGGNGAAYFTLTNNNTSAATFDQVASGAKVLSDDTTACPNSYVSIAPSLPDTFSPAVTVGAETTSGTQSIAGLVALAANAPSTCQNVTFTVTLTLEGTLT